jgi:hypothetical protein
MTTGLLTPTVAVDERRAREDLRAQIATLEARGARGPGLVQGPRLLSLGELERLRDGMLAASARPAAAPAAHAQLRLEAMLADPAAHRGERIALRELGRPGCGVYAVKPRLGLVGMLAGWWQVTLSSGCP